jgi:Glycosyltransferase Family 4
VRLLYCSFVTPHAGVAGELLVYRHLLGLEGASLMTVVRKEQPVAAELRPAVAISATPPARWIGRMRRGLLWPLADWLAARSLEAEFGRHADEFKPDVVCSVLTPDWFSLAAASYASRRKLPLVLFCHDDYAGFVPSARRQLASLYRRAAVRLCVSSAMVQEFTTRYGVEGEVLPPIPGAAPEAARQQTDGPAIAGFAGSIGDGYLDAMVALADALAEVGGRLVIASPTRRDLHQSLWRHRAVEDAGSLPHDAVKAALSAAGVNVLVVVQSFDPAGNRAFRLNFPSKLTEYATYGLPIVILAPADASSAVWANERAGAATVVCKPTVDHLRPAFQGLARAEQRQGAAYRFHLAAQEFDPNALHEKFRAALARAIASGHGFA